MPSSQFPIVAQSPGQIAAAITTTLDGGSSVIGYREDLAVNNLVTAALTNASGIVSYRWELLGRPEGSEAGGAGPEPIYLGGAPTATFTVDDDDFDYPRDGTYLLQCTVNFRAPTETRIRVALVRLNAAKLQDGRSLRMLGANETDEDTSIDTVRQGFANMGNRLMRAGFEVGTGADAFRMGDPETPDTYTGPRPDNVYLAGMNRALTADITQAIPPADTLTAVPLFVGAAGVLANLLQKTRNGVTGTARLAVYSNLAKSVYPDALLFDGGDQALTGFDLIDAVANLRVGPGLVWLVSNYDATFQGMSGLVDHLEADQMPPVLGTASDLLDGGGSNINFGVAWQHAQAFGATPTTFPNTAPVQIKAGVGAVAVPSVYFRWSL